MSKISKILIAIASLSLMGAFFLPLWQIDLAAPQYPEGLSMQIWLNKITGQVDIINGLNHYIGMKHIKAEMFPEFGYLTYVVMLFILLGLIVAVAGKRSFLFAFITLLVAGGVAAMVDFYQWGYDYGHNLDPSAAIQIPGLSYQPPLIGHKQLLNFDAYSYPANGSWIIIAAGLAFIIIWWAEWFRNRKKAPLKTIPSLPNKRSVAAVIALIFVLGSCKRKPETFVIGKDNCEFCKMTIMTPVFGGEIITKKGRIYKFDDLHCMIRYLKSGEINPQNIQETVSVDYNQPEKFIDVNNAAYVFAENLHSPMSSNTAAFSTEAVAKEKNQTIKGKLINWQTLVTKVR